MQCHGLVCDSERVNGNGQKHGREEDAAEKKLSERSDEREEFFDQMV